MNLKGNIVENELHDKLKQIEQQNNVKFTNTQKVFLTTEGSITSILDVLYGTVSLFTLNKRFEKCDEKTAELVNIEKGDEINYREVLIFRRGKPMIYALSIIPTSLCPDDVYNDLVEGKLPIGKILKKYKVETRREIHNIYIEKPDAKLQELYKTSEDFISREYVVIHNGEIIMWTKESFPISYFSQEI